MYQPFHQVVARSMERASRKVGLEYREDEARAVYERIPTWGPYPGVTEALNRLAEAVPLVIITNSDTAHAVRLAENLKAPFEVVISAEEMGVYKPRLSAFEYMFDKLGVTPDEIVHVSASPMYDHRSAAVMGIENGREVPCGPASPARMSSSRPPWAVSPRTSPRSAAPPSRSTSSPQSAAPRPGLERGNT